MSSVEQPLSGHDVRTPGGSDASTLSGSMPGGSDVRMRRDTSRRERAPADHMLRFVIDDTGRVVPDVAGKLPGRGIWVEASREALGRASARGVFAREARRRVSIGDDLAETVEKLLGERCLERLALARRAGQLVIGYDQVHSALSTRGGGVLILAEDAAKDAHRLRAMAGGRAVVEAFGRREMGARVGRDELVYAWMAPGALAASLLVDARRLGGFRDFEIVVPEDAISAGPKPLQKKVAKTQ